jgi:hypothetical protein
MDAKKIVDGAKKLCNCVTMDTISQHAMFSRCKYFYADGAQIFMGHISHA